MQSEVECQFVECMPNRSKGCPWRGVTEERAEHLQACRYQRQTHEPCTLRTAAAPGKVNVENQSSRYSILCTNYSQGCTWKGNLDEIEQHFPDCLYRKAMCPHCAQWMSACELKLHLQSYQQLQRDFPQSDLSNYEEEIKRLKLALKGKDDTIESLEEQLRVLENDQSESEKTLSYLEEDRQRRKYVNDMLKYRISLLQNINFNGSLIWKVTRFSVRTEDARTGRSVYTISPSFHSGRYGYKLCLCMYPFGYGTGNSTHMSLYLALLKGEFDIILHWPFKFQMLITLFNPVEPKEDLVEVFEPGRPSTCFREPTTEMTLGPGLPKFIDLRVLQRGGFIKDDCLFIKVKVNETKPAL